MQKRTEDDGAHARTTVLSAKANAKNGSLTDRGVRVGDVVDHGGQERLVKGQSSALAVFQHVVEHAETDLTIVRWLLGVLL
jgi:hypothetical protein